MTEHYYKENPNSHHDEKLISANFFNKKFIFKTDAGVFSKNRVDFGSSLLVTSLQDLSEGKILDLGCGYGSIGIVIASLLNNGKVLLTDVNRRAVDLANHNIDLNRTLINKNIEILASQSTGFSNIFDDNFDVILLNPPIRAGKEVINQMFAEAYNHLKDKGELWIVIQKKQGGPSAFKRLKSIFSQVEQVNHSKGYHIYKSIK